MAILKNLIVNGVARVIGDLTASKIIKQGGISSLFLKADGSIDGNAYIVLTSTARPGVTKLYRRDVNDGYNVLTLWDGTYWILLGYYEDTYHAPCRVSYADNADTLDGNHASAFATVGHTHSNYLERLRLWDSGDSNNADNLTTGTTFAYESHNAPTAGTIVAFSCTYGAYQLLLQGQYNAENLYFRNKNGDNGTWNAWRCVIHNGNIGSQSVKYADSAGSAPWEYITGKPINFKAYSGSLASGGWKIMQGNNSSPSIAISYNNEHAAWNSGTYSATLVYGCSDTRGLLDCACRTPRVTFGGCSYGGSDDNNPTWYMGISGTNGTTYNLDSMPYATLSGSATKSDYLTTRYIGEDGDTVAQVKLKILDSYTSLLRKQGYSILVNYFFVSMYSYDDYVIKPNGIYSLTYLTPGYDGKSYGQWLASCFGSERLYVFGRDNNLWTERKTIAWTSDIPTKVSQLTNDAGYKTTDTTYSTATSDTLGLVKIGYTANDKNYPVLLSNGQMYVNVPWTDTTYNFSGTTFYSGNSSNAEHNANNATANGHYYYNSNGPSGIGNTTTDGALYVLSYSDSWIGQIAQDYRNGRLFVRGKNNGSWTNWLNVLDSSNYSSFALPLSGGTITGTLTINRDASAIHYNNSSGVSQGWLGFSAADTPTVWMADGSTKYNLIHSGNIGSQSVNYATSAGSSNTATIAGSLGDNDTINMYAQYSNEINFGGGNSSTTIYFGSRTTDSRPIPTEFIFGNTTGTANLKASKFIKTGSSDSYVLLGAGGHKAISDFATSGHTHDYIPLSGSTNISGNLRFSREYTFQGYTPRKKGNGGGWNYKPFSIIDYSGSDFAHFGVYGENNDLKYIYIGSNDYDSNDNLRIYPNGNINANNFFSNSDIRYKNIIEYYYSLSDKIAQLPIIKYKWTDRDDDSIRIGSSALSVMSIIPELVSYDNNTDFYSLDYATLGAVAGISACKEVEMLKLKIKELELEIIILKSKYNG